MLDIFSHDLTLHNLTSYESLDTLADSYVPLLAVIIMVNIAARLNQPRQALAEFCKVLLLAVLAYGVMFVDNSLRLWASQGWDYSTHTAVAAACCWYLYWLKKGSGILGGIFRLKWVTLLWPISFVGYLLLMRYQGYHTWADMLTTCLALLPLFMLHHFATR